MALIMVVEDNPVNMKLARLLLQKEGYDVTEAKHAEEALGLLVKNRPDLIVLDVQLPGMDGLSLARVLRKNPETASIPLLALTSFAMKGDEERIIEAGFDCYFAKPYSYEPFLKSVSDLLRKRSAGG